MDRTRVWTLYNLCQTFQQRPADELNLGEEPWLAWDFDHAVYTLGRWIEAELAKVKLSKTEQKQDDWRETLRRKKTSRLERLLKPEKRDKVTVAKLAEQGVPVVRSSHRTSVPGDDDGH